MKNDIGTKLCTTEFKLCHLSQSYTSRNSIINLHLKCRSECLNLTENIGQSLKFINERASFPNNSAHFVNS